MKHQKLSKLLIIIMLFTLSFGFSTAPSLAKYSELQTKTIQQASKKTAIFPSKYGTDVDKEAPKTEKETIADTISKMVRALVLAIALFFAFIAILVKKRTGAFNIGGIIAQLTKGKKAHEEDIEIQQETTIEEQPKITLTEDELQNKRVRDLVFKFFEVNK
jgi:VanZ family protein